MPVVSTDLPVRVAGEGGTFVAVVELELPVAVLLDDVDELVDDEVVELPEALFKTC